MRIEMPTAPWDSAQRALDDAHTLTLPEVVTAPAPLLAFTPPGQEAVPGRVSSLTEQPPETLTLTF